MDHETRPARQTHRTTQIYCTPSDIVLSARCKRVADYTGRLAVLMPTLDIEPASYAKVVGQFVEDERSVAAAIHGHLVEIGEHAPIQHPRAVLADLDQMLSHPGSVVKKPQTLRNVGEAAARAALVGAWELACVLTSDPEERIRALWAQLEEEREACEQELQARVRRLLSSRPWLTRSEVVAVEIREYPGDLAAWVVLGEGEGG